MSSSGIYPPTSLSSLTDADRDFLRDLGSSDSAAGAVASKTRTESVTSPALTQHGNYSIAALIGDFDPTALMPDLTERGLNALLQECTVSSDGAESRWRLTASTRSRLLKEIAASGKLESTRRRARAWLRETSEEVDAITDVVLELTGTKRRDGLQIASLGKAHWAAYPAVLPAIEGAGLLTKTEADTIRSHVEHAQLLEPFRFLTGCDAISATDTFVGREKELERLRSFVDVLASKSLTESVARTIEGMFGGDERVLFLSGVGGVGKSTLAAKFMLQHAEYAGQKEWFRFAYLDFDRSTVHAVQPVTLLLEMIRQLSWQVPAAKQDLERLRQRIDDIVKTGMFSAAQAASAIERSASDMALPQEFVGSATLPLLIRDFAGLIRRRESPESVLLLVLDTFEEVQALGEEAVQRIEQFLMPIIEAFGRSARILIIGRDEAKELLPSAERKVLKEFRDIRSRRAFLERRGVDAAASERVAKVAGGLPLALLLAAQLVRERGLKAIELSLTERVTAVFRERFIVGILYQRILEHIDDESVRRVVHPGLVLRRLDADVIREIVVPVLGLRDFDATRIDKAMGLLRRQKDLVRVQSDGSVTHRPDVRIQMIGLMTAKDPVLARRLHAQAIDHYSRRQQDRDPNGEAAQRDRVEELYHRLCLGEALGAVVDRWIPRARVELARSLEEIPSEAGQRALKVMLGRSLTDDQAASLPEGLQRLFATQTVTTAVASQAPERALQVFESFGRFVAEDVADLYYPLALDRAGQWAEAGEAYQRLQESLPPLSPELEAISLPGPVSDRVLAVADYYERVGVETSAQAPLLSMIQSRLRAAPRQDTEGPTALLRLWLRSTPGGVAGVRSNLPVTDEFESVFGKLGPYDVSWELAINGNLVSFNREVADLVPLTERTVQQIEFLVKLLTRPHASAPGEADVLRQCERLMGRGMKRLHQSLQQLDVRGDQAAAKIVRHVMRPATPQWYVPLAASLRATAGPSIRTELLYDESLPELPVALPRRSSTTRSLADLLALFDHFGVLGHVLDRLLEREPALRERGSLGYLVTMYRGWRLDLLSHIDRWMLQLLFTDASPERRGGKKRS